MNGNHSRWYFPTAPLPRLMAVVNFSLKLRRTATDKNHKQRKFARRNDYSPHKLILAERKCGIMNIREILQLAVDLGASDIHFKVGMPPIFRISGELKPLMNVGRLSAEDTRNIANAIMTKSQRTEFELKHELDTAYALENVARFRVNVFQQMRSVGAVFRIIPWKAKEFGDLGLPAVLEAVALNQSGLILVTGATGSGKSTTLSAMLEYINTHRSCNMITIEDPIEFIFQDKRSIINQREVSIDTLSFSIALRQALRQDPDVIMVGEMRDKETIETALLAAETGHLVLSTLHTIDVMETINRILAVFPRESQGQLRLQLAAVMRAIISMRLIPKKGGGRIPAAEILVTTARARECICMPEKTCQIPNIMEEGVETYGMQTFDRALADLLDADLITQEDALKHCSNINNFSLKLEGVDQDGQYDGEGKVVNDDAIEENDADDQDDNITFRRY
jgi:twitching motility protein PilT